MAWKPVLTSDFGVHGPDCRFVPPDADTNAHMTFSGVNSLPRGHGFHVKQLSASDVRNGHRPGHSANPAFKGRRYSKGPEMPRQQRRLAAIVSADVVGYSRLMQADEAGTHSRLKDVYRSLVAPKIEEYGGRVVKLMGDGLLAEFPSVVSATEWALEVQTAISTASADEPSELRIEYRVGVNLGDVIVDGEDLYGDGVNIAARLQEIAPPGGICLSEGAFQQVRGKVRAEFADGGKATLKNIVGEQQVWRWPGATPAVVLSSVDVSLPVPGFAGRPAIAVLPFENLSRDPEQEYFVDGIAEDILTRLAMWRRFPVIARKSSFSYKGRSIGMKEVGRELGARYILEGSVRKAGNRVRITGQLIDAVGAYHIWAERYDRSIEDVFAVQDEIADAIVTALEPAVGRAEMQRAQRKNPENLDAWDLYQQGMWFLSKTTREDTERARALFRQSAAEDPNFAAPFAGLGLLGFLEVSLGYTANPAQAMATARVAAATSVRLDELDPLAQVALGYASSWNREYDAGVTAARRAVELNPSFALGYHCLGGANFLAGRFDEAVVAMERAVRIGPSDPWLFLFLNGVAGCRYMLKDYERSVEAAQLSVERFEQYPSGPRFLAMSLAQLGRKEEAARALTHFLNLSPGHTLASARHSYPLRQRADLEHFLDGLVKAGLPA
jgi:adenylate cyclase